jgi:membrane protease YdiL (CAAX protease family)
MDAPGSEQPASFRWGRPDLAAFAAFFLATVFFLPLVAFFALRVFNPKLQIENLSGVQQILMQALMDMVLVAFILLLVKALHGQRVLPTLHIIKHDLGIGRLILGGALLALAVLLASSFFPSPSRSPIERLLSTRSSIVVFVIFGIALAPLLEEIIFRGFLFTALEDVYGVRAAVPVTALLFAGLHVSQLRGNWPAVAVIFLVGYVFTVVRRRSGSIIPSLIMHTAYNTMIFGISALATVFGPAPKH